MYSTSTVPSNRKVTRVMRDPVGSCSLVVIETTSYRSIDSESQGLIPGFSFRARIALPGNWRRPISATSPFSGLASGADNSPCSPAPAYSFARKRGKQTSVLGV